MPFELEAAQVREWASKQKSLPWIFLEGELGAGKTTFVRELLAQMGFDPTQIQSPTFLKVLFYKNREGEGALHMDAYRVEDPAEYSRMGLEDYSDLKIACVEWPATFEKYLVQFPALRETMDIHAILRLRIDPESREVSIVAG